MPLYFLLAWIKDLPNASEPFGGAFPLIWCRLIEYRDLSNRCWENKKSQREDVKRNKQTADSEGENAVSIL